ncbi:hypothetical protein Tco_0671336 [Tanacetum coccineum]
MTTKPSFTILFIRAVIDWSLFADNGLERGLLLVGTTLWLRTEGGKIGMANTLRNALMVKNETMEKAEEEEKADDDGVGNLQRHIKHEQGDWQARRGVWMDQHDRSHLQIDPFPGREANYPPFGYTRPMPPGYDYRYDTAPDASS